jgi:hypothetical protein
MAKSINPSRNNPGKRVCCTLIALHFIFLPAWPVEGKLNKGRSSEEMALEGVRIEEVRNERTETLVATRIRIFTDAPAGKTWAVLQDMEEWDRFIKLFSHIAPLETEGTETQYLLSVSPPWPIGDFDSVIRVEKLPEERQILWKVEKAKLTGNHGILSVKEADGGSRIIYESYGPAKSAFPDWVMKIGINLVLPSVLKDFYREIREHC